MDRWPVARMPWSSSMPPPPPRGQRHRELIRAVLSLCGWAGPRSLLPRGWSDCTGANGVPPPSIAGQTSRVPSDPSAGALDAGAACLPTPVTQQGPDAWISEQLLPLPSIGLPTLEPRHTQGPPRPLGLRSLGFGTCPKPETCSASVRSVLGEYVPLATSVVYCTCEIWGREHPD